MSRIEKIGNATLYLGDCREILPTLPKVDLVLTDPPYGIADIWVGGSERHGWKKANSEAGLRNEWDASEPDASLIKQVVEKATVSFIWGGNYFDLPPSRRWLVWNKPERGFSLAEAELAWTNMDAVVRVFDYVRSEPDRIHPTQKPVRLMEWCLKLSPKTTSTVADPFMGSGTTGVACANMGKTFYGIEREQKYFDIACKRIEDAYRQVRLFE
jgi:site-specific DNA-methyltransferase (adenine-specific)